jgi:hypothetical protein
VPKPRPAPAARSPHRPPGEIADQDWTVADGGGPPGNGIMALARWLRQLDARRQAKGRPGEQEDFQPRAG